MLAAEPRLDRAEVRAGCRSPSADCIRRRFTIHDGMSGESGLIVVTSENGERGPLDPPTPYDEEKA